MYTYQTVVRLPDTDAAGILFFANYFRLAHDAYESFMESAGFSFSRLLNQERYLILIVHAEADYRKSLRLGETVTVELTAVDVQQSSFVLSYVLKGAGGRIAASLKTAHVAVDTVGGKKTPFPRPLGDALDTIR